MTHSNDDTFAEYKAHFERTMPDYASTYELFEREQIPVLRQMAMDDGLARVIYVVPATLVSRWNDDQFVNWLWRVLPNSKEQENRWVNRIDGYISYQSASYSTNF